MKPPPLPPTPPQPLPPTATDSTSALIAHGYPVSSPETSYYLWPSRWNLCSKAKKKGFPANTLQDGEEWCLPPLLLEHPHDRRHGQGYGKGYMNLSNNTSGRRFEEEGGGGCKERLVGAMGISMRQIRGGGVELKVLERFGEGAKEEVEISDFYHRAQLARVTSREGCLT
ncbi:hypothetical protein HOY80DRAFT_915130 [Tuber brumale]|nr:hypothetical protein HOY80DRAFT_915130 [Tuber brumale]